MNVKAVGYDLKSLQVDLQPGETFFCERGAIIYYEEGIQTKLDILGSGIGGLLKRSLSGESLAQIEMHNTTNSVRKAMVAGKMGLLPIDLKQYGGGIICRSGYYIASSAKVNFDFKLDVHSFIGGTGLFMQKITGNCTVFLDSIGSPISIAIAAGQSYNIDEKSFICMGINMQNQLSSNISVRNLVGGEGLNMFKVTGPGVVYVNSTNIKI
jgi:uncharacterized protein (AIM24 family)